MRWVWALLVLFTLAPVALAQPYEFEISVNGVSFKVKGVVAHQSPYLSEIWDDVVKGIYTQGMRIDWWDVYVLRSILAGPGSLHYTGELAFQGASWPVTIDYEIKSNHEWIAYVHVREGSSNLTAHWTLLYQMAGGQAQLIDDYRNLWQFAAMGMAFTVNATNAASKMEIRGGSRTVEAVLTKEGVVSAEYWPLTKSVYQLSLSGSGELAIGAIWYWNPAHPDDVFFHKETEWGTWQVTKTIIFQYYTTPLTPLGKAKELERIHPAAPVP